MVADESEAQTFEGGLFDWPLLLMFLVGVALLVAAPFLEDDAGPALLVGSLCLAISVPVLTMLTRRQVTIDREGVEMVTILRTRLAWDDVDRAGIAKRGPKLYFAQRGRHWRLHGVYARDFQARQALLAVEELMLKTRPDFARRAHDDAVKVARGRTPTSPERWLRRWGYWLSLAVLAATVVVWVLVLV